MSIMVTSKAVKVTEHRGFEPEKFPGIDQTIVEFNRDTINLIKSLWKGRKDRLLETLTTKITITRRMLDSRLLKDAPTNYTLRMDPLERKLYQEREILCSLLEFLTFAQQLAELA